MPGWFLSGHPIVNVSNGFFPLLRRPHRVRRPRGFGYPPLGLVHVHLVPIRTGAVTCPSSTPGAVGRAFRSPGGLVLIRGGWSITLVGSGCLSTLLGHHSHPALALSGVLSAPTRGGLASAWLLARGSRGWSLG